MKIAFPAAGTSSDLRQTLSSDFTQTGLIGLFDTASGQIEVLAQHSFVGSFAQTLQSLEVKLVIAPQLQPMALRVFREQGIEVYKAQGKLLQPNLQLLHQLQLRHYTLTEALAQQYTNCQEAACSSCSKTGCN